MGRLLGPIVVIAGTRPEVIKLAPVFRELQERKIQSEFWMTGQHLELANEPAHFFEIHSAKKWRVLKSGQSSNQLFSKLMSKLDLELKKKEPSAVIVQGDTTTALAGALAAFHRNIPIAHVEAGLRSGDLGSPFPEEMNRRVIDTIADWRFPPTRLSYEELQKEGYPNIHEPTGNTGIDALYWARKKVRSLKYWPTQVPKLPAGSRLILSTGHRRENLGEPLSRILRTLALEIQKRKDLILFHVVHPNPVALESAKQALSGSERVHLLSPLNYPGFVTLLDQASAVVSDSGGIQEEAPSFGVPAIITRENTERPEVLTCGGTLVGTDPEKLREALNKALLNDPTHRDPSQTEIIHTPFGDGRASQRILNRIIEDLQEQESSFQFVQLTRATPKLNFRQTTLY